MQIFYENIHRALEGFVEDVLMQVQIIPNPTVVSFVDHLVGCESMSIETNSTFSIRKTRSGKMLFQVEIPLEDESK